MARPIKRGLSYFPLDTDFMRDRKVQRLILEYGAEGISVFLGVLCEIYATEGYFLPVADEIYFDIGFTLQVSEERVKEIVGYCLKIRLFDRKMFKTKRVITSRGIQQRFKLICKRSKGEIDKAYCLLRATEVNVTETLQNVTITGVNTPDQSFSGAITPLKGKGKGKGKGNIKKKENKKEENYEFEQSGSYEKDQRADDGAETRRQQLLRMAADATAGTADA